MYCIHCGNKITEESKFCPKCGAKIDDCLEDAVKVQNTAEQQQAEVEDDNEEKKNYAKWVIPIAIIWFIIMGWLLSFSWTANTSDSAPQKSNQATPHIEHETTYEEEIRFQGYDWGTSAVTLCNDFDVQYYESATPGWSNADSYVPTSVYALGYRLWDLSAPDVAGYPVANLNMYCMYGYDGGELSTEPEYSELYLVTMNFDVVDVNEAYEDLRAKLTSIYGEGKVSHKTGSAVSTDVGYYKFNETITEWTGKNDTGIMLTVCTPNKDAPFAEAFHKYVALSYGITDSDKMLSALHKVYLDYEAKNEAENRDTSNLNGL